MVSFSSRTNVASRQDSPTGRVRNLYRASAFVLAAAAFGANAAEVVFDIEPQRTDAALLQLAEAAEVQILFSAQATKDTYSPGLKGSHSVHEALEATLAGTGLAHEFKSRDFVFVKSSSKSQSGDSRREDSRASANNERGSGVKLAQMQETAERSEGDEEDEESEAESEKALDLQAHVVTGSRIRRDPSQLAGQVIMLTNEDLRNSGAPTLEQVLRELPQNINGTTEFLGTQLYGDLSDTSGRMLGTSNINGSSTVNLRGLGESATLVLINGKRVGDSGLLGGFVDVSDIPISMVERVEIQMDGAASIYGSDAIGGVVNIILKDYDFVEARLRRTARTGGGLTEDNLSVNGGMTWGKGGLSLGFDAYLATSQSHSTTDLRLLRVQTYGYPGNVRGPRGSTINPREISSGLTAAAIAAGTIAPGETVNRVTIPEGQDGMNLTLLDFVGSANAFRTNENVDEPISVSPGSDRYTFRARIKQEVADWLNLEAGVTYAPRKTKSRIGEALGNITFAVAAENPYNPFGTDVRVDAHVAGFGPREANGERERLTLDFDLDGKIGDQWDWNIRSRFADSESMATTTNLINPKALAELVGDDRTDPSNALNVFGSSFFTDSNNAALLDSEDIHIPLQESSTTNRMASSELVIRGNLFALPAGPVRVVAGGEWRKTSLDVDYGNTFLRIVGVVSPVGQRVGLGFSQKGTRTLRAGFAEMLVPVISKSNALPGVRDLNLSVSARHDSTGGSSNAGGEAQTSYQSNVWSAGFVYRPNEAVKLRLNKSTSYRAPDIAYALLLPTIGPGFILDFRGGSFAIYPIDWIRDGNPTLSPEESTSVTAGIEFRPASLEGLALSIDYHETSFVNRIQQLNVAGTVLLDDTFERFRTQYTLDEDGRIATYDTRPNNVARIDTDGFDFRVDHDFDWAGNQFGFSANVALTRSYLEDNNTFDPVEAVEHVGLWVSRLGYWASAYWARNGWRLALTGQTRSSLHYEYLTRLSPEPGEVFVPVQATTHPARPVDFRASVDISEAWPTAPPLLQNMRLDFGMKNIFKSYSRVTLDPEPVGGNVGAARGTLQHRGLRYYMEISKQF